MYETNKTKNTRTTQNEKLCETLCKVEINFVVNHKFTNNNKFNVWHDRLGHPETTMMRKIIENSCGHSLKCQQIPQSKDFSCGTCSKGKLIIRPSQRKIESESLTFLERIEGDICGPIHPPCGPFRYFMLAGISATMPRTAPITRY